MDTSFGTPQGAASARALALGSIGVSLRLGSEALFLNPAVVEPLSGKVTLDVAIGLAQAQEDRMVPLFDSFQSFLVETSVAYNRNTYVDFQGGLAWRLPSEQLMNVGIGVYDRFDFRYDYFEEFRDPNSFSDPRDQLIENRELTVDGRLRSVTAGYAGDLWRDVRLGASAHRYFGDVTRTQNVQNFQTSRRTSDMLEQDMTGWGWSVGGWGRVNERVDLGASFEAAFTLDGTQTVTTSRGTGTAPDTVTTVSGRRDIDYPGTLRLGVTIHPRNVLKTTFAFEAERRFWEALDAPVVSPLGDVVQVRDTWELRLGLEHVFYNGLPVRFGFRYLENYADPESERSIFSAGIGYEFAGYTVDVTGLYHRQTSRQDFLFDPSYLTFQAPGSSEKVEDSVVQLVFGVSRSF